MAWRGDRHRRHRPTEDERRDQHDLVVLGVDLGRAEHVEVPRHRRVGVGQAHDHVLALHGLGAEHDARHVDRVLGTAGVGDRAHERLVRVADVAVDHLEMALVDRQVDRLAQRAAAVVEGAARVGQLHEVAEVLDRGVAPAVVEVVDERRAVGRHEDHVRVADDWTLRAGLRARWVKTRGAVAVTIERHMPRGKRTRCPVDVGAGAAEDLDRLGEVDDLDADLLEEGVGVVLDLLEALGRDDLDRRRASGSGRAACPGSGRGARVWRAARPRRTAGCSTSGAVIGLSSGSASADTERRATDMVRPLGSEAARQLPALVEGEARAAGRDARRRPGGTAMPRCGQRRRPGPSRRRASRR